MILTVETIATWITVFVALGGLLWRVALLTARINQNKKDIDGLGHKVKGIEEDLENSSANFTAKLDRAIDKLETNIHEMRTEMTAVGNTLHRIEGVLSTMKKEL